MRKQIPNMITSLNILSGAVAVIFAVTGNLVMAAWFIILGIFFDFFDGLAARMLNVQSPVGVQLDSLADVITSGLAPALIMMQLLDMAITAKTSAGNLLSFTDGWNFSYELYLPFIGLIIVIAAAYRLAKFNVDERQTDGFIGLPTPAAALLVLSLPLILEYQYSEWAVMLILNPWVLVILTFLSSVLMNAEVSLFALKFKTWDFKQNAMRYGFLILSLIMIITLKFWAIPLILLLYIVMSLATAKSIQSV